MPATTPHNHWNDWADNCLGAKRHLWTPFDIGSRITEPALLAVKPPRFPGVEPRWDAANYRFTNHDKANETIFSRSYRAGFGSIRVPKVYREVWETTFAFKVILPTSFHLRAILSFWGRL